MNQRIVQKSLAMQKLLQLAERYARTSSTVLIQGESGTGKELLARLIHEGSGRGHAPYIRVNCAALNENLLDSALFGHERGAFTGAESRQKGCFEAAEEGTLFLDEIGELPLHVQAKLLRVLEENEFQRIGSYETLPVTARIVAATNRRLKSEVAAGRFREDLFYRLDVLTLTIPPLRDRLADLPELADRFMDECRNDTGHAVTAISDAVMKQLLSLPWPGNARQLRNVIVRECLQCEGDTLVNIHVADAEEHDSPMAVLPPELQSLSLKEIERLVILSRLKLHAGNKSNAAETLEVTPRTLRNKLAIYDSERTAA